VNHVTIALRSKFVWKPYAVLPVLN